MNSQRTPEPVRPACNLSSGQSLGELINHIVVQHHAYLQRELPQLNWLAQQCAGQPSQSCDRFNHVHVVLAELTEELVQHMHKEEVVLFPWIQRLELGNRAAAHCGTIAMPIQVMVHEHDFANDALSRLRELTNDFTTQADSSAEYQALVAGLAALEADLHQHIHEENDILFPRAQELESTSSPERNLA